MALTHWSLKMCRNFAGVFFKGILLIDTLRAKGENDLR